MARVEEPMAAAAAAAAADRWAKSIGGGSTADATGDDWRPGKSTCWAIWRDELATFEVLQSRGDSLRSTGSVWRGRTMLHAEEGLWLAERGMLAVHPASPKAQRPAATAANPELTSSRPIREPPGAEQRGSEDIRILQQRRETERHEGVTMGAANLATTEGVAVPSVEAKFAARSTTGGSPPAVVPPPDFSCGGSGGAGDAGIEGFCPAAPSSKQLPAPLRRPPSPPRVSTSTPALAPAACLIAENQDAPSAIAGSALTQERRVAREGDGRKCEGGRRAAKRARTGADQGASPFLSIGALHETLSRAGVPWECYRAYAELKRRSYVVRRRPEDTIGNDDNSPRAAPLPWFRGPRVAAQHSTGDPVGGVGEPVVPVTFHLYAPNTPFKKRDPGPPDSLLAVCRYGDQMPTHEALVSLAESHANFGQRSKESRVTKFSSEARGRRGGSGGGGGESGDGTRDVAVKNLPPRGGKEKEGEADCQMFDVGGGLEGAGGGKREREAGTIVSVKGDGVPGVKLSVVSGEGNVHLFDVGLHDDMP